MKEFSSQTGGRYTYIDDFLNLQELALAFSSIFDDCDNFILTGCEVVGDSITEGMVFLNGKLRAFNGLNGITQWPQYIYEINTTENTPYQTGGEKVGRNVWGCTAGATVPTTQTQLTGKVPQSIQITQADGGLRMQDAWLGKMALLLNPTSGTQTVKGTVTADILQALNTLTAKQKLNVDTAGGLGSLYFNGDTLVLESAPKTAGSRYKFTVSPSSGFQLFKDSTLYATFGEDNITFTRPLYVTRGDFGSLSLHSTHLFNTNTAGDEGALNINMLGLNGGTTAFRNTHIGNGKNMSVLSVIGKTKEVAIYGKLSLDTSVAEGLVLLAKTARTNASLQKYILWQDANKENIAQIGYTSAEDRIFYITNTLESINITGIDSVNIGPAIKENGVLLSNKYVLRTTYATDMAKKADAQYYYSKTEADRTFALLSGGLAQFVSNTKTKEKLCQEIGALTETALTPFVKKDQYLSDMANTEEQKKFIRQNIGAAGTGDFQPILKDTGWVKITGITGDLYARQIGNIVCVQGNLYLPHSGTAFTVPNNIDAPKYDVGYEASIPENHWSCKIEANKKACVVVRCSYCNHTAPISFTYMT